MFSRLYFERPYIINSFSKYFKILVNFLDPDNDFFKQLLNQNTITNSNKKKFFFIVNSNKFFTFSDCSTNTVLNCITARFSQKITLKIITIVSFRKIIIIIFEVFNKTNLKLKHF